MKTGVINILYPRARSSGKSLRAILIMASVFLFSLSAATPAFAQKKFSKSYPASKNIKITLNSWSGAITVEGWDKNQIDIRADMEAPAARITPRLDDSGITIDVVRDNQGRGDVGSVNFRISVPVGSSVDIETNYGDLSVNNVNGSSVRAHVTADGNIALTRIRSERVMAHNISGDILFDGELLAGGIYTLQSNDGNINIRIPVNSTFSLNASAPIKREITLGPFAGSGLNYNSEGRVVTGRVGDARAILSIVNMRGSISFIRR
jgi:hypothetical protein